MNINTNLSAQIREMFKLDQSLRKQGVLNEELIGPLSELFRDKKVGKRKNKPDYGLANFLVYLLDSAHNYKISKLIEANGYPTQELVGKKAMAHFAVLIIHQDQDLELQEQCLKNCDFEKKHKAYLTDRILVNKGKKQIYGTQFKLDKKRKLYIPQPIRNKREMNKLRKQSSLPP